MKTAHARCAGGMPLVIVLAAALLLAAGRAGAQAAPEPAATPAPSVPTAQALPATAAVGTGPAAAAAAAAAPGAGRPAVADAVLGLLRERGLLDRVDQAAAAAEASPLVQQLRDRASDMVLSAMHFLGVPYRRGGNSAEEGFDCSGFTRYVFENSLGLVLPRRAAEQASSQALRQVARHELKPGDLVFFNTMRRAFSHVGIYVGDGKFIHAPRSGAEVRIEDMRAAYWTKRFNGARRADALRGAAGAGSTPDNARGDSPQVLDATRLRAINPALLQPASLGTQTFLPVPLPSAQP